MRLQVPLIIFTLLQLGLPTGIALEDEGKNNLEAVPRNLRGGRPDDVAIEQQEQPENNKDHPESSGVAEEEISDRELRPIAYPPNRQRPGQSQRYGRYGFYQPYTNPYTYVASGPPPREGPIPPHDHTFQHQHGWPYTNHQFPSPRHEHTIRHSHGLYAPAPGDNVNGVFIIGGQPGDGPNSLSEALGFNRLDPGDPIVFLPQVPVPTSPTRQPTNEPTWSPLPLPTDD